MSQRFRIKEWDEPRIGFRNVKIEGFDTEEFIKCACCRDSVRSGERVEFDSFDTDCPEEPNGEVFFFCYGGGDCLAAIMFIADKGSK